MTRKPVHIAFEKAECTVSVANIVSQRAITPAYRRSLKYRQIAKSIEMVGVIRATYDLRSCCTYVLHRRLKMCSALPLFQVS
jgi:hypothetical protein